MNIHFIKCISCSFRHYKLKKTGEEEEEEDVEKKTFHDNSHLSRKEQTVLVQYVLKRYYIQRTALKIMLKTSATFRHIQLAAKHKEVISSFC